MIINRLRKRFMLSIVMVVMAIIVVIITILMMTSTTRRGKKIQQNMWLMSISIHTKSDLIDEHHKDYSYIVINRNTHIINKCETNFSKNEINRFINNVTNFKSCEGVYISSENKEYMYINNSFDNDENIIVFVPSSKKAEDWWQEIQIYILVLFISILLAFIASIYLSRMAILPVKEAWDKQVKFIADASHELRTPLTAIQTNLDVLCMYGEETIDSQMKWIKNIDISNSRMIKMVEKLLFIAKVDSGKLQYENVNFDMSTAVAEIIDSLQSVAQLKDIDLICTIQDSIIFNGDKELIQQLIVIFIDNAIKYTDNGGRVEVNLKTSNGKINISISDTGQGISQKELNKIFDRFYKVDKSRSKEKNSTGLGLSIAKEIIQIYNGKINVDSTVGEGTCFTIVI